ncbi:receptor-type guanylate cyclase Gyc76C-like [Dendronephthya gigantea]|uniref:receptor-type guanylate cyclase Gyc76C-like n=1 Tax=Dendronephthya gigantea TaxID=151771 RepID=UPI0010695089|nr:receptor-type guanylate cyclase Gyc76C-like [Dendronephthya gigantea]XP_028395102.1 receptor-type guanylate cyclase Gyc76C-like [Dendronephthya gigantea]XP_028395103.1 receptor-type guanylate cyclase Gyc76C-like [Dendronephthya gigantea]
MKIEIVLILIAVLILHHSSAYHIGFFVPIAPPYSLQANDGKSYAHALTIAVDDVNNNSTILPSHNLSYSWTNSWKSDAVLQSMYSKYISPCNTSTPVDVFIGPAFDCSAPAKVAESFNIPMISYYCRDSDHPKSKYPLFINTYQNTNAQAASALFTLLEYQKWKRIAIILEEDGEFWKEFETKVHKRTALRVVKTVVVPKAQKFNTFGVNYGEFKPDVQRNRSIAKVREVLSDLANKERVKIFVLLTSFDVLIEIMAEAHDLGLTKIKKPHRVFIGFQLDAKVRRTNYVRQSEMFFSTQPTNSLDLMYRSKRGSRSLLIISAAQPVNNDRYEKFRKELVRRTEYVEPFKFELEYDLVTKQTEISETANALYDAVYQYGLVLHRLHERNINITAQRVVEEFRSHSYLGISGYESIFTNATGILKVHLSLLHMTTDTTWANVKDDSNIKTIGSFTTNLNSSMKLTIPKKSIAWPWGKQWPTDMRTCEDDNYDCKEEEVNVAQSIVPTLVAVLFFIIFLVLGGFFLRQWKRERILKRSVWQIDINEIIFDRKISTDSKASNDSGIRLTDLQDYEAYSLLEDTKDFFPNNNAIMEEGTDVMLMKSFSAVKSMSGSYKGDRVFVKVLPKIVDISKPMERELRMLRHIHHENLNPFIGLGCENSYLWVVMQLGSKGTLEEVLANPDITLDHRFVLSLVYDIAKGMTFLHNSDIKSHGNLKSSNCVVDNRWVLKITDYGIPDVRSRQARYMGPDNEDKKFRDLLWKAPELLREADPPINGTRKGDVYSFSIILEEFHTMKSPYSNSEIPARDIVDRVVDGEYPPYRPVVIHSIENAERLLALMKECWREVPEKRPSFQEIKYDVESAMTRSGLKTDICDNMISLLENYSNELEHVVSQRTRELRDEKHKTDALLDRMLPRSVAEQLKRGETVQAESFSSVTIYFSDIIQFTALCADSTPMEVVDMLNDLYLLFDDIIMDYSVYKVETIGDAYMVVSGLPTRNGKLHASEISCMALEILENVKKFKVGHKPEHELQIRIGIHTGPVVAGVVGMTMPRYCLFGDTVNTASRMESNGKGLQIHVSESTAEVLDELGGFHLKQRPEEVYLKGKGNCTTYWLLGASPDVPRCPRKLSKKAMKPLFQSSDTRKYSQPFRTRKKTQISFPRASVA